MPKTVNPKGRTREVIAFSAPPGLRDEIDAAAERDGRNRSQLIVRTMQAMLRRRK